MAHLNDSSEQESIENRLIDLIESSSNINEREIRKEVDKLLKENKDREYLNKPGENGITPLILACRRLMLSVVRLLLESGSNPNIVDLESNSSPLIHTVQQIGNRDLILSIVGCLLKNGADANLADSNGRTPLMVTSSARIAYELIQAGSARIDAKDSSGTTALMRAVHCRNYDLVSVLIDRGADIYECDSEGKYAIDYLDLFASSEFKLFVVSKYLDALYVYFKSSMVYCQEDKQCDESDFPFKKCHLTAMKHLIIEIDGMSTKKSLVDRDFILAHFHFLPYFTSSDFKQKLFGYLLNLMGKSNLEAFLDDGNEFFSPAKVSCPTSTNLILVRDFYDSFVLAAERIFAEINRSLIDAEYPDEFKQLLVDYLNKFEDCHFFIHQSSPASAIC